MRGVRADFATTRIVKTVVICFIVMLGIGLAGYFDGREQKAQQYAAEQYQKGIREGRRLQAIADKNLACSTKEYLSRDPKYYQPQKEQ